MTLFERVKSLFSRQTDSENREHVSHWHDKIQSMTGFYYTTGSGGFRSWDGSKYPGAVSSAPRIIYKNYTELRAQARRAFLESTEARSIIGRRADLSIHTGLRMQSTPVWLLIDPNKKIKDEDRLAWVTNHEQRWKLYFESKESDATGQWSGGQIQRFINVRNSVEGEILAIIRYKDTPGRMSPIALQFYRPEQLGAVAPDSQELSAIDKRGNSYQFGIELTSELEPVAYYIDGIRVPKFGPDGRLWVIHYFEKEEVGQVRGISPLSPILHDLHKLTGYKVAELQAAVINASIAAWVEPGNAPSSKPMAGISKKSEYQQKDTTVNQAPSQAQIVQPGIFIQNLKANEKINSFNTSRPNVNFGNFLRDTMKYLAGSLGLPVEVLEMTFSQNYSASRATLILAQRTFEILRENDVSGFHKDWHRAWFEEEVRKGNIKVSNFESPVIKNSWLKTDWFGISKPDIDPQKTATARKQNLDLGLTTHEREALDYNGSEFEENVRALKEENRILAEANQYLNSPESPNPKPSSDKQSEDKDPEDQEDEEEE